jgi:hypothetical protein
VTEVWIEVVRVLTWQHHRANVTHLGYTMHAGTRGWCWACGWRVDPRGDADPEARGRFALGALAMLGEVVSNAAVIASSPDLLERWTATQKILESWNGDVGAEGG